MSTLHDAEIAALKARFEDVVRRIDAHADEIDRHRGDIGRLLDFRAQASTKWAVLGAVVMIALTAMGALLSAAVKLGPG